MAEENHRLGAHSPEYALLGFLYEQPNHGYNLHRELADELGLIWHISQSQTYAILKRLQAQHFITASTVKQEKLPARQVLHITPAGRRRFDHWLRTASGSSSRAIRLEFITRLYFAHKLFPETIPTMLEDQSAEIEAALQRLGKKLTSIPPEQTFNRLGLELRLRQLHSIREWLNECRQIFEPGS